MPAQALSSAALRGEGKPVSCGLVAGRHCGDWGALHSLLLRWWAQLGVLLWFALRVTEPDLGAGYPAFPSSGRTRDNVEEAETGRWSDSVSRSDGKVGRETVDAQKGGQETGTRKARSRRCGQMQ